MGYFPTLCCSSRYPGRPPYFSNSPPVYGCCVDNGSVVTEDKSPWTRPFICLHILNMGYGGLGAS